MEESKDGASRKRLSPEEVMERRLSVVRVLLNARGNPNTFDSLDRTPLDLAIAEGGPGSENLEIVSKLRELGLVHNHEAARTVRNEFDASTAARAGSRLTGNTPKPKAKGKNPALGNNRPRT